MVTCFSFVSIKLNGWWCCLDFGKLVYCIVQRLSLVPVALLAQRVSWSSVDSSSALPRSTQLAPAYMLAQSRTASLACFCSIAFGFKFGCAFIFYTLRFNLLRNKVRVGISFVNYEGNI